MECFIVESANIHLDQNELILSGDEAHHATRSLRIRAGEELLATDLSGTCYRCHVERANHDAVFCSIDEILPNYGEPERNVLLLQGMISQPSRWEFLLEKATELGVSAIQPITTERTERANFNRDRSERILRAAVKQTKRARLPELRELSSFGTALSQAIMEGRGVLLLHEGSTVASTNSRSRPLGGEPLAILIGPEGGFSDSEVELASRSGALITSLGPRRLRAETAAIAALARLIDH